MGGNILFSLEQISDAIASSIKSELDGDDEN